MLLSFLRATSILIMISAVFQADLGRSSELPADVARFAYGRDKCDHFRGEESDEQARKNDIASALKLFCAGTDRRLKDLKAKYRGTKSIIDYLGKYEEHIE